MNKRVFTVGSLIPGSIIVKPASAPIADKKVKAEPASIIVEQKGNRFEIHPVKGKLLDAALNQEKPIQYKCRKGTCGQCTVRVVQSQGLSQPNEKERDKLKNELTNGYRLACQAEIL
jgi:ferredoxin, 2Fe-2S